MRYGMLTPSRALFFIVVGTLLCEGRLSAQEPQINNTPVWRTNSVYAYPTNAIAWVDIDSDGDLDLAFANEGPNTIYINEDGILSDMPTFVTDGGDTHAMSWGDYDSDGDPDVAYGEWGGAVLLYKNTAGTLEFDYSLSSGLWNDLEWVDFDSDGDLDLSCGLTGANLIFRNSDNRLEPVAVWQSVSTIGTTDLAWSDYDMDGDLDLCCANFHGRNTLYVNNDGILETTPLWYSSEELGTQSVEWVDVDGDGDPDLSFGNWGENTIYLNDNGVLSLFWQSQEGLPTNAIAWADYDLDGDLDMAVGNFNGSDRIYTNNNGLLVKQWSGVAAEGTLSLAWGDYDNDGDLDLMVGKAAENVLYRNDLTTFLATRPILDFAAITIGDSTSTTVSLTNRGTEWLTVVALDIDTNAFAIPDSTLLLVREGVPVAPGATWPLTVFFTPPTSGEYAGTLDIHSTVMGRAQQTPILLAGRVRPLSFLVANNYPSGIAELDVPVRVTAVMGDSVDSDAAWIRYRVGGSTEPSSVPMTLLDDTENDQWFGLIAQDTINTLRGLEYWVEVENGPVSLAGDFNYLRTQSRLVEFPNPTTAKTYQQISFPGEIENNIYGSIGVSLGSANASQWRLFSYDSASQAYTELPTESEFRIETGRGYWLITRTAVELNTGPGTFLSTPSDSTFTVTLYPGYNLVGNPFAFSVAWDSLLVDDLPISDAGSSFLEPPIKWDSETGYSLGARTLEPWQGYWIKNISNPARALILQIPPRSAPDDSSQKVAGQDNGWRADITAVCGSAVDLANCVGVAKLASYSRDQYDLSEPPPIPGQGISLYFPHGEWSNNPGAYTVDIRPERDQSEQGDCHIWHFDVAKNYTKNSGYDEVVLRVPSIRDFPSRAKIILVDQDLARSIDLRKEGSYSFLLGVKSSVVLQSEARFCLIVGDESRVDLAVQDLVHLPLHTALHQNRPNPFNSSTIIRMDVERAGPLRVRIYDLAGSLVNVLHDGFAAAGSYEFPWRGLDGAGREVSSGVYVYTVESVGYSNAKKMLLVK